MQDTVNQGSKMQDTVNQGSNLVGREYHKINQYWSTCVGGVAFWGNIRVIGIYFYD